MTTAWPSTGAAGRVKVTAPVRARERIVVGWVAAMVPVVAVEMVEAAAKAATCPTVTLAGMVPRVPLGRMGRTVMISSPVRGVGAGGGTWAMNRAAVATARMLLIIC
jgi:hypothetical protein